MRNDMKKRLEKLNRVPLYIMQKRKINKLEREIESLQETIKDDLYVSFMERLNENYEVERLRKENRKLTEEEIPLIISEKEQIINKSGLLEYFHPKEYLTNVGGLDNLKEWIHKRGQAYSDEAKETEADWYSISPNGYIARINKLGSNEDEKKVMMSIYYYGTAYKVLKGN